MSVIIIILRLNHYLNKILDVQPLLWKTVESSFERPPKAVSKTPPITAKLGTIDLLMVGSGLHPGFLSVVSWVQLSLTKDRGIWNLAAADNFKITYLECLHKVCKKRPRGPEPGQWMGDIIFLMKLARMLKGHSKHTLNQPLFWYKWLHLEQTYCMMQHFLGNAEIPNLELYQTKYVTIYFNYSKLAVSFIM